MQEFLHSMRTKDGVRRIDTLTLHLLSLLRWDSHYHPLNGSHLLWSYVLRHVVCQLHNLLLFLGSKLRLTLVLWQTLRHIRYGLSVQHWWLHFHWISRLDGSLNLRWMLLHLVPKVLDRHLLRHRIGLWKLILIHALHCHLLLHKRHLRLLRVEELLLLLGLALTSVIYSFQLTAALSLVRLLQGMSANGPALSCRWPTLSGHVSNLLFSNEIAMPKVWFRLYSGLTRDNWVIL